MLSAGKSILLMLAIIFLIIPIAGSSLCADSHDVACETTCACDCHTAPTLAFGNNVNAPIAPVAQTAVISCPNWSEILLVADVFRPPISA